MTFSEMWLKGWLINGSFSEEELLWRMIGGILVFGMLLPYVCGSINSAVIISRVLYRDDVRKHGSGNAGMTNMLRTYGKGAALLTLLGDLLKTALAVSIGSLFMSFVLGGWVACLFCMLGHVFPVFHRFRGGKGVLCAAVGILILSPFTFVCGFLVFVILVASTRYVSLGSVVAALMLPLFVNAENQLRATGGINGLIAVLMALLIVWCHRANIGRIMRREESKLSFGKKKKDGDK